MGDGFTVFGGLDFSGAKEPLSNLWACTGVERDGGLVVTDLRPHAYRADAADAIVSSAGDGGRALWGLDFPFALPVDATRELLGGDDPGWDDLLRWVASHPPSDLVEALPTYAKSTRSVDAGSKALAPLDLRLHKQTVEGMRLLHGLRDRVGAAIAPLAPAEASPVTLIEVYPTVTANDLGLRGRKPRRAGDAGARREQLRPYVTFDHPSLEATAATIEDAWDAVLACVTAYRVRGHLDQPEGRSPLTAIEGWIYRDPAAVGS